MKFKINYKLFLVISWMVLVFMLSGQVAVVSSETSGFAITIISKIFGTEFSNMDLVQFIVRKLAHFSLYAVGGMLIFWYVLDYNFSIKKKITTSFLCTFLYACTDELHQMFVAGRSCEVRDVCIDSLGGICGISIIYFIIKILKIVDITK